jgi:hypothetical protein
LLTDSRVFDASTNNTLSSFDLEAVVGSVATFNDDVVVVVVVVVAVVVGFKTKAPADPEETIKNDV